MGGCQNYGPFLGTLNIRCRIIIGIQKGTIILTTTHMGDVGRMLMYVQIKAYSFLIFQVAPEVLGAWKESDFTDEYY